MEVLSMEKNKIFEVKDEQDCVGCIGRSIWNILGEGGTVIDSLISLPLLELLRTLEEAPEVSKISEKSAGILDIEGYEQI